MNVLKKVVVICMVFLMLSVRVYAKRSGGNFHNNGKAPKKQKNMHIYPFDEAVPEKASDAISTANEEESIMPVSTGLGITSHIKLNDINVGEDGLRIIDNANMTCNFVVFNSSDEQGNLNILLATYTEDGRLCNINTYSREVASNANENIQISYQFNAETEYRAKILIWDSLSQMMPVRAEIDFSQDSGINAYYYNADNRLIQIDKANGKSLIFTYDNMGNLLQKSIRE